MASKVANDWAACKNPMMNRIRSASVAKGSMKVSRRTVPGFTSNSGCVL